MKKLYILMMLIVALSLNAQALFEVKDASDNTVLEVSNDGLRIFNEGDTLMVISSSEIKAFVDASAKDKGLSRSFSVSTNATGKGDNKIFDIVASEGATFYNPNDNTDKILSISDSSIIANVNPTLNRDFIINDQAAVKGGGNLMKISNEDTFVAVDDSTMLWYKQKNAFRVGHVLIASDSEVGQASFAAGRQTKASGDYSTALGYGSEASGLRSFASGTSTATGHNSIAMGHNTDAVGDFTTAMGYKATATGQYSTVMGYVTDAIGRYSTAIGYYTTAQPYCSFVIGRYNKIGGTSTSWVDAEGLFVIGNGSSSSSRSNAMQVFKNGNVSFPGVYNNVGELPTSKVLLINSSGILSVAAKGDGPSNDEEIELLKKENERLNNRLNKIEELLKKFNK